MSLREVQVIAGQRNKSAAQYHFGDRHGLIEAIATARMGPINEVRQRLLDDLDEPTVRQLVEVIVEPLAEATLHRGSCWARFLAQSWTDPELSRVVRRCFEAGPYREARQRLIAALDDIPEELRERRVDHAVAVVVMSLAATEAAGRVAPLRRGPGQRPHRHRHRSPRGPRLPRHRGRPALAAAPPRLKPRSHHAHPRARTPRRRPHP